MCSVVVIWFSLMLNVLNGGFELCLGKIDIVIRSARARFVTNHTEDDGDEKECRYCRDKQTADNSAAESRILLAAFAKPERHRHHADDHGKRCHQHRTQT